MAPSFSLDYYDQIFGIENPAYGELLQALALELEDYAHSLKSILGARDSTALTRLRHSHRPMIENLKLAVLHGLEMEILQAMDTGAPATVLSELADRFVCEAMAQAEALRSFTSRPLRGD